MSSSDGEAPRLYVLRVATLHDVCQENRSKASERKRSATQQSWSTVKVSPSQYSEKLLASLEGRLKGIAKGEDKRYRNDVFRRCAAAFWANWADPSWINQTKSSRKVEELLLQFFACAVRIVRKSPDISESDSSAAADNQLGLFVRVLQEECQGSSPPDTRTFEWLEEHQTLLQQDSQAQHGKSKQPVTSSWSLRQIALELFDSVTDKEIIDVERMSTVKAAVAELQAQMADLQAERSGSEPLLDGFAEEAEWRAWAAAEEKVLSERLRVMEDLAKLASGDGQDVDQNLRSSFDSSRASSGAIFTPPNPREAYARIVATCLDKDLAAMAELPDSDFVSVDILSQEHLALLAECADHWRILPSSHFTAVLDIMAQLLEEGKIPLECFAEALDAASDSFVNRKPGEWRQHDSDAVRRIAKRSMTQLQSSYLDILDDYDQAGLAEVDNSLDLLDKLADLSSMTTPQSLRAETKQAGQFRLETAAGDRYDAKVEEYRKTGAGEAEVLHETFRWLEKQAKQVDKRYDATCTNGLDICSTVISTLIAKYAGTATSILTGTRASKVCEDILGGAEAITGYFDMWRDIKKASKMLEAYTGSALDLDEFEAAILPLLQAWLQNAGATCREWTDNAISLDLFTELDAAGCSSSLGDIFSFLNSILDTLTGLNWPRNAGYADLVAQIAQLVQQTLWHYCDRLSELFRKELAPDPSTSAEVRRASFSRPAAFKRLAWTSRQSAESVEPQNITVKSCSMLNDVTSAMDRLDEFYHKADIDKWADGKVSRSSAQPASVYTIKVVQADLGDLVGVTPALSRPAVVVSSEAGACMLQTRPADDAFFPTWNETMDLRLQGRTWYMVTLASDSASSVGRAYFKLDEADFPDLATRGLWLNLDHGGRLLIRITREAEKADPQYFFGLTFKHLRRGQGEMIRSYVELMKSTIRATLARTTLLRLANGASRDGPKDLAARLQATYLAIGRNRQAEIPSAGPPRLTDAEMEAAINPLLDYLDANLQLLSAVLTPVNMQHILSAVWSSILQAIEDLIVPSLSDRPSSMRPLKDHEFDIVVKWLQFLRDYCHAGGEGLGLTLEELHTASYQEILRIRIYYDWPTDDLMEECVREYQRSIRAAGSGRVPNAARAQRNLGTIRQTTQQRRQLRSTATGCQMMLRVLRMRRGAESFLVDQLRLLQNASSWATAL